MKGKSESEVAQSCPTLRDPMDCSLPGSSIHGIFQARVLEWGAIAFSMLRTGQVQMSLTSKWISCGTFMIDYDSVIKKKLLGFPWNRIYLPHILLCLLPGWTIIFLYDHSFFLELLTDLDFVSLALCVHHVLCCALSLSRAQFFASSWIVAHQAPRSVEFSRQEYWSGLPGPPPGDLPDPRIEPRSPTMQVDSLPPEPPGKPWVYDTFTLK